MERPASSSSRTVGGRSGRLAWVLLALLGGCGDSIAPRVDLVVLGGQPGTVRVGDRTAVLQPRGQTTLVDVGEGPYTVHVDLPDERLTLLEVPGPIVDLEFHLPFADPLVDEQIDLCFEPEPAEGFQVAAFDGVLRLPPAERGGSCIRAPLDRPIEVVALWSASAALEHPHLTRLSIRSALHTRLWPIRPEVALDAQIGVAIDGSPPARIEVELTLDDVRTGLVLGAGLATTGSAVGVPLLMPCSALPLPLALPTPPTPPTPPRRLQAYAPTLSRAWPQGTTFRCGGATASRSSSGTSIGARPFGSTPTTTSVST